MFWGPTSARTVTAIASLLLFSNAACEGKGQNEQEAAESASARGQRGQRKQGKSASAQANASAAPGPAADPGPPKAASDAAHPNVLVVLVDDQRAAAASCMPKLRELVTKQGVEFENAFSPTPLCCPARSSILTGLYAHSHGVLHNGDLEADDEEKTPGVFDFNKNNNEQRVIARYFREAGYRTALIGKYLNAYDELLEKQPGYVPPHWDDWYVFPHAEYFDFQLVEKPKGADRAVTRCYPTNGPGKGLGKGPPGCSKGADETAAEDENYSTDVLTERALTVIEAAAKANEPFFLYYAPKAPHGPYTSPKRYQPDAKSSSFTDQALTRISGCSLYDWKDRPASFMEQDVSDKPRWVKQVSKDNEERVFDELRRKQLISVLAVEDGLEKMTQKLKQLGIDRNTIIIYAGDNGFAWGDHGYKGKNCVYDECIKVPLIIYDPRFPGGGRKEPAFVMNVDMAPTFADLLGFKFQPDKPLDGRSFAGLINGKGAQLREEILIECWGTGKKAHPPTTAGVRGKKWKYVEHYEDVERKVPERAKGDVVRELYDLEKDPHELDNLLGLKKKELADKGYDAKTVDAVVAEQKQKLSAMKGP